ncbi:hypothetical protein NDU88_007332 [Pleurodeles waltl]|uniref:Uncharacterized protein n=1 Tax=Pleurodeles waltl TaxID=8319 RepID=A0AAV7TZI6_PLEWA|nr:hypothetical protein NDU88_007332 [Pleurodeles waltl]
MCPGHCGPGVVALHLGAHSPRQDLCLSPLSIFSVHHKGAVGPGPLLLQPTAKSSFEEAAGRGTSGAPLPLQSKHCTDWAFRAQWAVPASQARGVINPARGALRGRDRGVRLPSLAR